MRRALTGVVALALLASAVPAVAKNPLPYRLRGALVQGGLVVGWAIPGSTVTLDGKPLRLADDGWFVFGFGRDHKPAAVLAVTIPEGGTFKRTLEVRQRKYRIQRITGTPKQFDRKIDPESPLYKRLEREYFLVKRARERQTALPHFRERFVWPVIGRVSGLFGSQRVINGKPRRPHFGVDIAVGRGTPIRAAASGVVSLAYDQLYFAGRTVLIDHGMGVSTVYIHMDRIAVRQGQRVRRGQVIGAVGTSGRSTGPHLHWGLNWNTLPLDPRLVVGPMPKPRRGNAPLKHQRRKN